MASIDIATLRAAAGGDQDRKVEVTKRWLSTVADELVDLERFRSKARGGLHHDVIEGLFGRGRR